MPPKITRDKNGTPHVEAKTKAEMYWGQDSSMPAIGAFKC